MKTKYLGIKVVEAVEMTAEEAKKLGYKTGDPENIKGFEVTYQDGYKSWCQLGVQVCKAFHEAVKKKVSVLARERYCC